MSSSICKSACWLVVGLVAATAAGCAQSDYGDMAQVTGIVTLDGAPVENAMVIFAPKEGGRPSRGVTDATGKYELVYIRDTMGAVPGEHRVMIETIAPDQPDNDRGTKFKDPIPVKYNKRSNLTETLELGPNTIDFELSKK